MFCKYCGKELADDVKFCSGCGKRLAGELDSGQSKSEEKPAFENNGRVSQFETKSEPAQYTPSESPKSRLVAALLAFFLGEFGAHRFYAGKTASAIWQIIFGFSFLIGLICMAVDCPEAGIVFFILGLVWAVWVLVDFITILCGSFKDKNGLPLVNWDF